MVILARTVPPECETERRIDKPRGEMREPSCSGYHRCHLCRTLKHSPHDRSHDGEREEETQGSCHGETFSYADEQAYTDPTSQTDKGDVAGLEVTAHDGRMVRVGRCRRVDDVAIVRDLLLDVLVDVGVRLVATRCLHRRESCYVLRVWN